MPSPRLEEEESAGFSNSKFLQLCHKRAASIFASATAPRTALGPESASKDLEAFMFETTILVPQDEENS